VQPKTRQRITKTRRASLLAIMAILMNACSPSNKTALPTGLAIEEHALVQAPTLDPLDFETLSDSMETILARHEVERSKSFSDTSLLVEGHFSLRVPFGADTLTASEYYDESGTRGWITLQRNTSEIYRIDTGMGSPVTSLRGLWVYDGHWVLESIYIVQDRVIGRISQDGQLLSDSNGYQETFEFQLMHGRPFYFFMRDGKLGLQYDGHEVVEGYDEIPHYGCCSAAELNPRRAENMIAFFARRGSTWYYVEAGIFQ
jgi:hypothetical protein